MNELIISPDLNGEEMRFRTLIKSKLTLKNGMETNVVTLVPYGMSFEDINAGLVRGFEYSGIVQHVQSDIYTLRSNNTSKYFSSISTDVEDIYPKRGIEQPNV